jgi:transcriptional regulator with XRE-family HTH domain
MEAKKFIKEKRHELGLTQPEIAAITGYNKQMIVNYETGRARVPGDLVLQIQAMLAAQQKRKVEATR